MTENIRLENDQVFPTIVAPNVVGGDKVTIPADLTGSWGVLIFYRGHW